MVAMDLGPEARYKDERCVKYERSASKVNRVLYIPYLISTLLREAHGRFWQVQWKLLAGAVEVSGRSVGSSR